MNAREYARQPKNAKRRLLKELRQNIRCGLPDKGCGWTGLNLIDNRIRKRNIICALLCNEFGYSEERLDALCMRLLTGRKA